MRQLIVKTSSLGDLLHTFPTLDYLAEKGEVHWVVEERCAALIEAHPKVARVITINSKEWRGRQALREQRYDVAFDLQGNLKSGIILSQVRAKEKVGFGKPAVAEWPNLLFTRSKFNPPKGKNIREDYLFVVQSYFGDFRPITSGDVVLAAPPVHVERGILVCPGSAWPNKQVTPEMLITFVRSLGKPPVYVLWGSPEEKALAEKIAQSVPGGRLLPPCTVPQLQGVMRQMELVISMDSLPLHLCGTTKTPSISFFGPSSAEKYRPLGEQHRVIIGPCPYGVTFEKRCPKLRTCQTGACLKSIDQRRCSAPQDRSPSPL